VGRVLRALARGGAVLGLCLLLAACGLPPNGIGVLGVHLAGPRGFAVRGNRIYGPDGRPFLVRGVDRPSLEWTAAGEHLSLQDFQRMRSWGANTVRIPLNQDFWLSTSCAYAPGYAARVRQAVAWAEEAGLQVVILDLHWSDEGQDQNTLFCSVPPGQQAMPDTNSLTFWRQVAAAFRTDGRVWLELYNEPHDVPWSVWRDGGQVRDPKTGLVWTAVGMQQLYDAVRGVGWRNPVVVGGLDWAYDLRGLPRYALRGWGIVYAVHPYDYPGKQPADWPAHFGFAAKTWPVVATEFGEMDCGSAYDQAFLDYAARTGIGWTAWAWYPGGCKFPALLQDWEGTPTAAGEVVRRALAATTARRG
jgi:endoglucanase